jgi:DNA-binding NarL/FixJ family response regulator
VVVGGVQSYSGQGIACLLEEDQRIEVAAVVADDADLARAILSSHPTVVLAGERLDYTLVLSLRMQPRPVRPLFLIESPARLYLTLLVATGLPHVALNVPPQALRAAVHRAARADQSFQGIASAGRARSLSLTDRENDVLPYLIAGAKYDEIAGALQLSRHTVRAHTRSICQKLNVKAKDVLIGQWHLSRARTTLPHRAVRGA